MTGDQFEVDDQIVTDNRRHAVKLYAALMSEIRARTGAVEKAANGETGLPDVFALEICYLQIRMLCETLALACLAAHGDLDETQTQWMQKEYSADKILSRLEEINPMFFPSPVKIIPVHNPPPSVRMLDAEGEFLCRTDIAKIYGRCGNIIHRGTAKKLEPLSFSGEVDFTEVVDLAKRFIDLLGLHNMVLFDETIFHCTLRGSDGKVHVSFATPINQV